MVQKLNRGAVLFLKFHDEFVYKQSLSFERNCDNERCPTWGSQFNTINEIKSAPAISIQKTKNQSNVASWKKRLQSLISISWDLCCHVIVGSSVLPVSSGLLITGGLIFPSPLENINEVSIYSRLRLVYSNGRILAGGEVLKRNQTALVGYGWSLYLACKLPPEQGAG